MQSHHRILFALFLLATPIVVAQESCACESADQRAFDFWIGQWEVFLPDGSPAGTNTITRIEGGCALKEEWISLATEGYTGTSYNFYNSSAKQWEQLWIDNQGAHLKLKGGMKDKSMVLQGDPVRGVAGRMQVNRITWTPNPDGTVRQLWEVSFDEENTWSVAFDGKYVPVNR